MLGNLKYFPPFSITLLPQLILKMRLPLQPTSLPDCGTISFRSSFLIVSDSMYIFYLDWLSSLLSAFLLCFPSTQLIQ